MALSKEDILNELHKIIALFLGPGEVINMEKMIPIRPDDSVDQKIEECLSYIRTITKYALYDLEATRREKK